MDPPDVVDERDAAAGVDVELRATAAPLGPIADECGRPVLQASPEDAGRERFVERPS